VALVHLQENQSIHNHVHALILGHAHIRLVHRDLLAEAGQEVQAGQGLQENHLHKEKEAQHLNQKLFL